MLFTNPREIKSVRLDSDASEISKHAELDVAGDFGGLDVHSGGIDTDSRINLLIHRLVRANIVSYLEPQVLLGPWWVHTDVVGAVPQYLLVISLQYNRIFADALDEKDAITELPGKIVEDLGALRSCHQRGVQDLQTGKLLKLIALTRYWSRGLFFSLAAFQYSVRFLRSMFSFGIHSLYFVNTRFTCSPVLLHVVWRTENVCMELNYRYRDRSSSVYGMRMRWIETATSLACTVSNVECYVGHT